MKKHHSLTSLSLTLAIVSALLNSLTAPIMAAGYFECKFPGPNFLPCITTGAVTSQGATLSCFGAPYFAWSIYSGFTATGNQCVADEHSRMQCVDGLQPHMGTATKITRGCNRLFGIYTLSTETVTITIDCPSGFVTSYLCIPLG